MPNPTKEKDPQQEALFREVSEELKKDRYLKFWEQYRVYIIGAVSAVVLGAAGWQGWTAYDQSRRQEQSDRFAAATALAERGGGADSVQAFTALAEDANAGYATLARLRAAGLLVENGDVPGAVAIYEAMAADSAVDPLYRDLAVLLIGLSTFDSAEPSQLKARLTPLTAEGNPWRFMALELTAHLAQRTGDTGQAREIFIQLADDASAPPALQSRAREMLEILGES